MPQQIPTSLINTTELNTDMQFLETVLEEQEGNNYEFNPLDPATIDCIDSKKVKQEEPIVQLHAASKG